MRMKFNASRLLAVATAVALITTSAGSVFAETPGAGWWTSFTLQNPSSTATVNISLLDANVVQGGDAAKDTSSSGQCPVKPGASVIFNPGLEANYKADGSGGPRIGFGSKCESGNLASGFQGGVVVSSDGALVSVVSIGNNKNGTVGVDGGKASAFYQGMSSTSKTLTFPVAKNNFGGQTTTYYIQAVADANVTVKYSNGTSDGPFAISAGRTRIFSMPSGLPGDKAYAATATSTTGDIAGVVVEHPNVGNPATFALSTRAFTPSDADTTVYVPSLKNDFSGGTTGLAVQAVGGPVTIVVDFSITNSAGGATCTASSSAAVNLADGESAVYGGSQDRNLPAGFGNGCFGSGTIRVTTGTGKIVATVNETSGQGKAVYGGFGSGTASTKVAVPLVKEAFFGGATAVVAQAVGTSAQNTKISASYVSSGACASGCVVTPNSATGAGPETIVGGAANNFRRLNDFSAQYKGTLPALGTNNAVILTSSSLPIVAIAQETASGLDVKNYEGFKQ